MIAWADVTAFASELSSVDVATQTDILAYVNAALAPDAFGGEASARLRIARIYLAAHHGALSLRSSAAGPVVSRSEGDLSVTYGYSLASAASGDPLLDSTEYGKLYRQLVRTTAALRGPFVA